MNVHRIGLMAATLWLFIIVDYAVAKGGSPSFYLNNFHPPTVTPAAAPLSCFGKAVMMGYRKSILPRCRHELGTGTLSK